MAKTNNTNHLLSTAADVSLGRMKMFAKNNPWRPIYIACVLFLVIGYLFYFSAYLLPTPQWGRELMIWAMPTVKGLDSAARVGAIRGTDPFPAQVVILYCALGSILLTVWCVCKGSFNERLLQEMLCNCRKVPREKRPSKFQYFFAGVAALLAGIFCLYMAFWFSASNITWHDFKFHSSSTGSASFLLVVAVTMPLVVVVSPPMFYLSLFQNKFSKES